MQPTADAPIARKRTPPPELIHSLGDRFQERCSTSQSVRQQHGRDDSPYDTTPPDCVVFPTSSAEVAEVVRVCADIGSPSSPTAPGRRSKGTSWPSRGASPSTCPG